MHPPQDMTDPPQDMTDPPQDMTPPPQDKTGCPQDMTGCPQDLTHPPQDMTDPPQVMTDSPQDVTDPPQDITDSPQDMTYPPHDMTDPPPDMTHSPQDMTDPAQEETNAESPAPDALLIGALCNQQADGANLEVLHPAEAQQAKPKLMVPIFRRRTCALQVPSPPQDPIHPGRLPNSSDPIDLGPRSRDAAEDMIEEELEKGNGIFTIK